MSKVINMVIPGGGQVQISGTYDKLGNTVIQLALDDLSAFASSGVIVGYVSLT